VSCLRSLGWLGVKELVQSVWNEALSVHETEAINEGALLYTHSKCIEEERERSRGFRLKRHTDQQKPMHVQVGAYYRVRRSAIRGREGEEGLRCP